MKQVANDPESILAHDDFVLVDEIIDHVAHLLPQQGPIKDFVHHNTLHAFQYLPFHEGVKQAGRIFGSNAYVSSSFYRRAFLEEKLSVAALELALSIDSDQAGSIADRKRQIIDQLSMNSPTVTNGIECGQKGQSQVSRLNGVVHPLLFRLVANFLDQGIAIWAMPGRHGRFWSAVDAIANGTLISCPPLSDKGCRTLFRREPAKVIVDLLKILVPQRENWRDYVEKMCLDHPGWSGMVRMVEMQPALLSHPRQISLQEVVALELILRYGWMERVPELAADHMRMHEISQSDLGTSNANARYLHDAFEWTYYGQLLRHLRDHQPSHIPSPKVQAFFCIDDREGSLRRHLETLAPDITTFGAPGFFGVDFLFQGADRAVATQHCPVILTPKHVVKEPANNSKRGEYLRRGFHLWEVANSGVRGWVTTPIFGLWAMLKLSLQILGGAGQRRSGDPQVEPVPLPVERIGDARDTQGRLLGYSQEEMADRVGAILRNCGLKSGFADLVVMVAHGATTNNNPHFAAYDCGACAGKHGWPNARAFATMANHQGVRELLKAKGIVIPASTYFLAAMHDTTSDDITYYDEAAIPASHRSLVAEFKSSMERALELNAQERVRKFDLAPTDPRAARKHVRQRSHALFEPRPEWNHAGNAAAIVGRRTLTRGLNLGRRVFMQSYDPTVDPTGDILANLLGAVIPVCGGINLEYLFSRIDNEVYGAGSKLPHNVIGLLGVAAGVAGDLLTGLPSQMVEIHDPVRLLVMVEQTPAVAMAAAAKNPAIFEWVQNEWVRFVAMDPDSKQCSVWVDGAFRKFDPANLRIS